MSGLGLALIVETQMLKEQHDVSPLDAELRDHLNMKRDAALWRKLIAMHFLDLFDLVDSCDCIEDFIDTVNNQ
jgi:hypothetical protein